MRTLYFLAAGFLSFGTAVADTMIFSAAQDATLYQTASGSESGGAGLQLMVGRVGTNDATPLRRTLLQFDLSSLPAGATVTSATLTLELFKLNNSSATLVNVHRVTSSWNAGLVNPGTGGQGAAAAPGDATWLHRSSPTIWTAAGGDFLGVPSASQTVSGIGLYDWTGSGLAADVQAWANSPSQNFGWELIGDEAVARSVKEFSSMDSQSANKPRLVVNFTVVPEPGIAGLALGGLLILASRRKR